MEKDYGGFDRQIRLSRVLAAAGRLAESAIGVCMQVAEGFSQANAGEAGLRAEAHRQHQIDAVIAASAPIPDYVPSDWK